MLPDAWCVHCYLMVDGCVQEVAEAAARARGELKDANIQLKAGYPYYSYCINIRVADPKPLKKNLPKGRDEDPTFFFTDPDYKP